MPTHWQRRRERVCVFLNTDPNEWGSHPRSSTPASPILTLVGFVGLCLLVGLADASIIVGVPRSWYLSLLRPPGTPPDWVFAPVCGALYVVIGLAGWLVWCRTGGSRPLRLWGWQLAVNACWTPAFFALHSPRLALLVNLVLFALVLRTIRAFAGERRLAAWLMLPYLGWTSYMTWLSAGFWWLNQS